MFSVTGSAFYVAALVFVVAGMVYVVATRCLMCPRSLFCCRTDAFSLRNAGEDRRGKRGGKPVFCVRGPSYGIADVNVIVDDIN